MLGLKVNTRVNLSPQHFCHKNLLPCISLGAIEENAEAYTALKRRIDVHETGILQEPLYVCCGEYRRCKNIVVDMVGIAMITALLIID